MTRNMEHTDEVFVRESRVSSTSIRTWICLAALLCCSEDAARATRNSFVCVWDSAVTDNAVELACLSTSSVSSRCNVVRASDCMSAFSDVARAGLPVNGIGKFSSRGEGTFGLFISSTS